MYKMTLECLITPESKDTVKGYENQVRNQDRLKEASTD